MECKKIIMVINPDEYLNSQNLIENMARATCDLNLVVMSKPDKQKSRKSGLFNNVIKKWEMNDLVTVIKPSYSDELLLKWSNIIPKSIKENADVFNVSKELLQSIKGLTRLGLRYYSQHLQNISRVLQQKIFYAKAAEYTMFLKGK